MTSGKVSGKINLTVLYFLIVLLAVAALGTIYKSKFSTTDTPTAVPSYPDNSPLGVTNNFYQWYTSCISEGAEDEGAKEPTGICYQKTTYLESTMIKEIDNSQKSILCNKMLDFHSVKVSMNSQTDDSAVTEVANAKTNIEIAVITLKKVNGNWLIYDINCSP